VAGAEAATPRTCASAMAVALAARSACSATVASSVLRMPARPPGVDAASPMAAASWYDHDSTSVVSSDACTRTQAWQDDTPRAQCGRGWCEGRGGGCASRSHQGKQ
jgi:hypothetical protein